MNNHSPLRLAINGFGRIGRIFFRQAFGRPEFDIVALNDLGAPENLAYLLKYDTVYGRYERDIEGSNVKTSLMIDGKEIRVLQEKDPSKLPWQALDIDVVVESTGVFATSEKAKVHLDTGAQWVVVTAPTHDEVTPTATPNVGFQNLAHDRRISSNASCTTNATVPVVAIMMKTVGVEKGMLNTVHGMTATQALVDSEAKSSDFRRGRAAAHNIVPSTTGAAEAVARVIPELKGEFEGVAMRVPVIAGSIIDFTFVTKRPTTVAEINDIFRSEAKKAEWQGILKVVEEQIVSSDIVGEPYGSIVDLTLTHVVDGDLVKVCSWYDNEWGYCAMLLKHIESLRPFLSLVKGRRIRR